MKRNAFTLIELLAVIIIIAIIALIAVPIVIHIINDSKKSSEEQSLELYRDSVQKAIANYQMTHPNFNPTECKIQDSGDIKCGTTDIKVEMKGTKPNSGLIMIKDNKVTLRSVKLNDKKYYSYATLVSDADNDGEVSIGDKYTYKVNDTDTFNFYVLSFNNDDTVNLIMDRNICNDGTVNYTIANSYCKRAWHSDGNDNNYGPDTIMTYLYNGTKSWSNVPDMIMNYIDENNINNETNGYTSIITNTSTKVTTITGKQNKISGNQIFGNKIQPLKARLPKQNEISEAGCKGSFGSCPIWLMENMKYYNVTNDKYSMNNNNKSYQNISGYWLLPSDSNKSTDARIVEYYGRLNQGYGHTGYVNFGARPVITVSIDDLS